MVARRVVDRPERLEIENAVGAASALASASLTAKEEDNVCTISAPPPTTVSGTRWVLGKYDLNYCPTPYPPIVQFFGISESIEIWLDLQKKKKEKLRLLSYKSLILFTFSFRKLQNQKIGISHRIGLHLFFTLLMPQKPESTYMFFFWGEAGQRSKIKSC